MAQVMDIVRGKFLEKQLIVLPKEIVYIIRGYDGFYRDYFSKNVILSLNITVNKFWENKMVDCYTNISNLYNPNYIKKIDDYYNILWNVLIIDNVSGDTGLIMFD